MLDWRKYTTVIGDWMSLLPRWASWSLVALVLVFPAFKLGGLALDEARPVAADYFALARVVEERSDVIRIAAAESGVDAAFLAAVMCKESSGRLNVRSHANALGLFQLRMPTAIERAERLSLPKPTEEDLLSDGLLNARLGADYMAYLLDRFDQDEEQALIAYNMGPTRLARQIRERNGWEAWRAERVAAGDSQLLAYVKKVMEFRAKIEKRKIFN